MTPAVTPSHGFRPRFYPLDFDTEKAHLSSAPAKRKPRPRQTLRTVMLDAQRRMQGAKIDMVTGEVVPFAYKDYSSGMLKARRNPNAPDTDPFWMHPSSMADTGPLAQEAAPAAAKPDRSRKKLVNATKSHLESYVSLADAIVDHPDLDHILYGAASLDMGGNTRGLNRKRLFTMLQNLDFITSHAVRQFAGHSKSHSEKVATCLSIIVHAFMSKRSLT